MGIRTILVVNHDFIDRIAKDKEALAEFISALGSSRSYAETKAPYGIKILAQGHNSMPINLKVT